ncbi:MAG: hypothetical protein QXF40_05815 [Metallosphaera sp.]
MCYLNISKIDRPIIEKNVVLLRKEKFERIETERYIKILSTHQRFDISKSYFYFTLNKIREMGLVTKNGLAFKAAIPFEIKKDKVELKEKILYVTEDKELLLMDLERDEYACKSCSIRSLCVSYLKKVAKESKVQLEKERPRDAWKELIIAMERNVIENATYLRISGLESTEREKELKESEISC